MPRSKLEKSAKGRLSNAILAGEAYALRNDLSDPLANLPSETQLAERVARSFGGAAADQFVRARLKYIRLKPYTAKLRAVAPRRGFDSLVEALMPLLPVREAERFELQIARLLRAEPDDIVVINLAIRLRAIARR